LGRDNRAERTLQVFGILNAVAADQGNVIGDPNMQVTERAIGADGVIVAKAEERVGAAMRLYISTQSLPGFRAHAGERGVFYRNKSRLLPRLVHDKAVGIVFD
jgi:hypothetical protein